MRGFTFFTELLEQKAQCERLIKERAMIYDVHEKETAAELIGLPFDTFYHLSFDKWSEICRKLRLFKDRAEREWNGSNKTTLGEIWRWYKQICERAKIKTELDEIKDKYKG